MNEQSRTGSASRSRRDVLRTAGLAGLGVAGLPAVLTACGNGSATGAAATASSTSTAAPAKLKVALGWIPNVEFAGYWIAQSKGYYAAENLTVDFMPGGGSAPDPTVSVSGGVADLGIHPAMASVVQAVTKGNDFVMIGAQYQSSPGGLVSLASDPVKTPQDLVGAKILGQQGTQAGIEAVLQLAGLPKKFSFIPVGFDPSPLVRKRGKAYTCFVTNQPITLEETFHLQPGRDYEVVTYAELGLPSYADVVFCKRSFLRSKGDVLQRFMRATVKGWQDNAKDPSVAAKLAVTRYGVDLGLDLKQQVRQNVLQIPLTQSALTRSKGLFRIDESLLGGEMYDAMRASGTNELPDVAKIVDRSVLDAVYRGKASI